MNFATNYTKNSDSYLALSQRLARTAATLRRLALGHIVRAAAIRYGYFKCFAYINLRTNKGG